MPAPRLQLTSFGGGLNSANMPEDIKPYELQDCMNFLLDSAGKLEPRLGTTKLYSQEITGSADCIGIGVYQASDGTEKTVIRAGDKLYYNSGAAWVEIQKSGGDAFDTGGDRATFVNFNGYLVICDGFNFMRYDGATLEDLQWHADWLDCASDFGGGTTYNFDSSNADKFFPYYAAEHDNRLFVMNIRVEPSGGGEALFPNVMAWCASMDMLNWETDTGSGDVMNFIKFDDKLSGAVSFYDKMVLFGATKSRLIHHDAGYHGSYYYPTATALANVGALPFTMVKTNRDVMFANEAGVYSLTAVQKYGDLENARVSQKIDDIFSSDLAVANKDKCSAIYVDWRDEYWLSIPISTGYKVLVGNTTIRDDLGAPPWMPLDISARDWTIQPRTRRILFSPSGDNTYLKYYNGRNDDGDNINMYYQTKVFGSETYERKRIGRIAFSKKRWGTISNDENGTFSIIEGTTTRKAKTVSFDGVGTTALWGTAVWGAFNWTTAVGSIQKAIWKIRASLYAQSFSLKWLYESQHSGAVVTNILVYANVAEDKA